MKWRQLAVISEARLRSLIRGGHLPPAASQFFEYLIDRLFTGTNGIFL